MISRAAPEFWQLYRELPPKIQAAARSAYQLFSHEFLRIPVCGWSDYTLIRGPGLFTSQETLVPSHFAATTSGYGSGLARTKSSTADFRARFKPHGAKRFTKALPSPI